MNDFCIFLMAAGGLGEDSLEVNHYYPKLLIPNQHHLFWWKLLHLKEFFSLGESQIPFENLMKAVTLLPQKYMYLQTTSGGSDPPQALVYERVVSR